MIEERPPYRAAACASVAVLGGYLLTLAPTVTFWDAGEFITAARTLGIPHPPGTPLFVLIAHTWGLLFAVGEYAWRLNLLSALCGAVAAGCWFLVAEATAKRMYHGIGSEPRRALSLGAGAAAALLTAFSFTNWQNSVETEVYSIAMLSIAMASWLSIRWRAHRGSPYGSRLLLMMLYLGGISIGNHLLALLAGPALIVGLLVESRAQPLGSGEAAASEWARIAVVATVWLLFIATGLGSGSLMLLAGALVALGVGAAARTRQAPFAAVALLIAIVSVSPYLFLLIRSRQGPWLNEAAPATWDALLSVIRRAQYAVRTPLDDPTVMHGADNPGRTLTMFGYQLANYAQYFDWQWAKSIGITTAPSVGRLLVTLGAFSLGLRGALAQKRGDRSGFSLLLTLWLVTGLGLVVYMNFKPGATVGWDRWLDVTQHEVRERDYFFVASFVAWGVWVALGISDLIHSLMLRVRGFARGALLSLFVLGAVPLVLNARVATRSSGPETTLARDFARALLQSVPPGGILFTWGDNDTFPLWYAQSVEGVRRDVTVVCLALAETGWYMRSMRDVPSEPVDRARLATIWRDTPAPVIDWPLHQLSDEAIATFVPQRIDQDLTVVLPNGLVVQLPKGSPIFGKDLLLLNIVRQNAGRRPISWSVTAAQKLFNLGPHLVQQGLALTMPTAAPDSTHLVGGAARGPGGALLDLDATRELMAQSWDFGALLTGDVGTLDANIRGMTATIALPYAQVGVALAGRGDTAAAIAAFERAVWLAPQPAIQGALDELRRGWAGRR